MLAGIYRDEWGVDELLDSQVLRETRAIFGRAIDKGVPRSTSHRTAFRQRLKASTDVFSAFRVHRQAQDVAAQLVDENGNRRSFRDWAERVQPYLNHQNRAWLQTEYSTAIRRAHDEADWVRYQEDADIYPNLEWVPSTSAHPGADHKGYWGTVLPKSDPFWREHRPGDRWNCKCSLRQTDKAPTAAPRVSGAKYAPQPGLRTKPGKGQLFSEDHPYFPQSCKVCPFSGGKLAALWHSLVGGKKDCYECRRVRTVVERSDEAGGKTAKSPEMRVKDIVDDIVRRGYSAEPFVEVGHMESEVMKALKKQGIKPGEDAIVLTPERAVHALRKVKAARGAALTPAEFADICDHLRNADVYFDPSHDNLLYVVEKGGRVLKFVVQPNYKLKRVGFVNAVVTAGVIETANLKEYEKIK